MGPRQSSRDPSMRRQQVFFPASAARLGGRRSQRAYNGPSQSGVRRPGRTLYEKSTFLMLVRAFRQERCRLRCLLPRLSAPRRGVAALPRTPRSFLGQPLAAGPQGRQREIVMARAV